MKDRLQIFLRKKTGKAVCGVMVLFILTTSAYGTAVQVVNFPSLMTMIQKMVTQAIIDKIRSVWNEEVRIKLEPGIINTRAVSFIKYSMSPYTDQMITQYMKNNAGAFSKGDGKYFAEMAKKKAPLVIPSVNADFKEYQKKVREVSILLAGIPGGGVERMQHFTTAEHAATKLRDVFSQASVASYEKAAGGVFMAEKYRKELFRFKIKALSSLSSSLHSSTYVKVRLRRLLIAASISSSI